MLPMLQLALVTEKNYSFNALLGLHSPSKCFHTTGGMWEVTDNLGITCDISSLLSTGCCDMRKAKSYLTCRVCDQELGCCDNYEYCVSCCLAHMPLPDTLVFIENIFVKCTHTCRVSSKSIQRGNHYKTLPFCYDMGIWLHGQYLAEDDLLIGKEGQSCTQACKTVGRHCASATISLLNECKASKKYFPCERCVEAGYHGLFIVTPRNKHLQSSRKNSKTCFLQRHARNMTCHSQYKDLAQLCHCHAIDI